MLHYVGMRLLRALLTIAGIVTLVFVLVRAIPGDPVDAILGDQATTEDRAAMRRALLLDRPLHVQYVAFLRSVADGSLGTSFRQRDRTVRSRVAEVFPYTLELALAAVAIAWLLAIPLGLAAAVRRRSLWDRLATSVAVLGVAIPHIWLGPLLILGFAVELRWLPMPGADDAPLASLVLPAVTLGVGLAAILTRQTRAAMIEVLGEHYITAARARGLGPLRVLVKHGLRNALLPVATVGAAQLGAVLSGAVVSEKIFERPGLGSLLLEAFFSRDIPVLEGCVLVVAILYVLVNLALDLAYVGLDPRVRLG